MARRGLSGGQLQRAGAVAWILASLGFVVLRCAVSPEIPFIAGADGVAWIAAPLPVSASLQQWGSPEAPRVTFSRGFAGSGGSQPVLLRLRALRRFRVELNGAPLAERRDAARWREEVRVDLTGRLDPERNELRIEVRNLRGPALLWLRIEGLAEPLAGDPSWRVSVDGRALGAAVFADDTRPNPAAFAVETPLEALAAQADSALLLVAIGGLGFLAGRRLLGPRALSLLPGVALGAAALAWVALFFSKLVALPLEVGFDARHHMEYVEFLRTQGRLPLATDGWSLYHPPLFYAASAAMAWLGSLASGGAPAPIFLKAIPFLCGLGSLWVAFSLARRLFPEDPRVSLLAVVFAAALPMNLYSSAYFSNEAPHALLVGLALLAAVGLLRARRVAPRGMVALGAALGLAALTKFTALLVAPIALFFVGCKLLLAERASLARSAGLLAASAATALGLAGWFYLRAWIELGHPLVGNWDLPGAGLTWWQQPGFHTLSYYTGFGEALRHPYLAGFHSFWDGVYSTLWGDGGIAGRVFPADRHPLWNYGFMSMGYLVALPATALTLLGAARCAVLALRHENPGLRAALSFVVATSYAVGLSVLFLTLRLPFFAQAKAFYGLSMAGPLSVFFAVGAASCDRALAPPRWLPVRVLLHAWVALFAGALFLSYAG